MKNLQEIKRQRDLVTNTILENVTYINARDEMIDMALKHFDEIIDNYYYHLVGHVNDLDTAIRLSVKSFNESFNLQDEKEITVSVKGEGVTYDDGIPTREFDTIIYLISNNHFKFIISIGEQRETVGEFVYIHNIDVQGEASLNEMIGYISDQLD